MADELPAEGSWDGLELTSTLILQTENDILLRAELEDIAKRHPEQFVLWYTLDRPPKGRDTWKCLCLSLSGLHSCSRGQQSNVKCSCLTLWNSSFETNLTPHPVLKRDLSQVGVKKWELTIDLIWVRCVTQCIFSCIPVFRSFHQKLSSVLGYLPNQVMLACCWH